MTTKIQKWGNSYAVRLPKAIIERMGLSVGREVTITEQGESFSVTPATKEETLTQMVSRITPASRHNTVDWGEPVGKEIW